MSTTELIDNTIQSQLKTDKSQTPGLTPEQIELARQEKEGQYKIWLEMPQTKELIVDVITHIEAINDSLDRSAATSADDALRVMLAHRAAFKQVLNHLYKGKI
jgi:hypothetical protein